MKNIMVLDGAMNCAYDIYAATDAEFALLFPMAGQDICFIEELEASQEDIGFLKDIWSRPVRKKDVRGIHGTLFIGMPEKMEFYPNRRDSDLDGWARPFSSDGP